MRVKRYDVAIVGAGVLGLAHAYHLAKRGIKVGVFERGQRALGASVRNFGMIWPIGQPPENHDLALGSRAYWLEVLAASGIWHECCGSLHLAYHEDELAVLDEFVAKSRNLGYGGELISANMAKSRSPFIRRDGLVGAMWSPAELCVFPRQAIAELPTFLTGLGVEFAFGVAVTSIERGRLIAGGKEVEAEHVLVCSGDDFESLFPDFFASSGMTRSKLQMMRMRSSHPGFVLGAHLCAGLTLGHYGNFRICDRLADLLERYAKELPRHVEFGIHLLVSQHADGQITVGDSHEYGLTATPFISQQIEELVLGYLDTFLPTIDLTVTERWYGVYAKHPTRPYVVEQPIPGVTVVTGVGGAGMTLSFGLAAKVVTELLGVG